MVRRVGFVAAKAAALGLVASMLTVLPAVGAGPVVATPADGSAYFGVILGNGDTPSTYAQRSGLSPASYGHFAEFPLTSTTKQSLSAAVDAISAQNGKLFLTVEPQGGLSSVTNASAQDLAATVAGYNARGVDVFLRFAHEMNGSWYAWGQQPTAYISAFRLVADAVHSAAPSTAMVWAPNYGGGYPYAGGAYSARTGTTDFRSLDTNGSGSLSMSDDPYAPYYPGDTYVDWVGLTLYHFGHAWPYGENEVPEAGKFAQQLQGTYTGNGQYENQSALPSYYQDFAVAKGKPLAISETAALFNESPAQPGSSEYDIKTRWITEVYGEGTRTAFPQLKLVNWFEVRKFESEASGTVDWRATASTPVADVLRSQVTSGGYRFAAAPTAPPPATVTTAGAPTSLTATTAQSQVTLNWRPPASTGGAAITGYLACRTDNGACRTVSGTTLTTAFTGLSRKTTYTFTVRATNSAGTGSPATVTSRTK